MFASYLFRRSRTGDGLSRAQIAAAVPAGSRRPRSQGGFLRVLQADEDLDRVRADFREHVLEFARIHARYASWTDMTTRPTRARVCGLAGFGISTYKKCRRWLEQHGYLGLVEAGSTPEFQPAILRRSPDQGNTAAVYVLSVPAAREKRLTRLIKSLRRVTRPPSAISQMRDLSTSRGAETKRGDLPDLSILRAGPLKNLSDRALAACTRRFLAAGWTVADVQHAVDHRFGGEPWRFSLQTVRRPAGWLRWRLRHWTGADGQPLPSRSQQLEAATPPRPAGWLNWRLEQWVSTDRQPLPARNEQISDAVRKAWRPARPAAAAADPAPWAARIRAQLGWARPPHVQAELDLGLS